MTLLQKVTDWIPDTPLQRSLEEMAEEYDLIKYGSWLCPVRLRVRDETTFAEGLRRTIDWYHKVRGELVGSGAPGS